MQISLLDSLDGLCLLVPGYVLHVTGKSSAAQDTLDLKVAVAYKL